MKVEDLASAVDNRIVESAIRLQTENKPYNIGIITNDLNMRGVVRSYGIRTERCSLRQDVSDSGMMNDISHVGLA